MKKFCTAFVLILALTGILCSCTATDNTPADTDAATTTTAAATTTTTTMPTTAYTGVALHMPDSIEWNNCYSSALNLTICPAGPNAIKFYSIYGGEKMVVLTSSEIVTLNKLYESITDFSNIDDVDELSKDVTLVDNGKTYRFCSVLTTQEELEQYLNLLDSYYENYEYDWSVVPRDK